MSEFVRPDVIHRVPIKGGELLLSPSHDFLHHWRRNGAWMLKYVNMESDPPSFHNVILGEEAAQFLIQECGIEVCYREYMGTQEFNHYLQWQEMNLDQLDFEADDSVE